jgi:hypothetical protein
MRASSGAARSSAARARASRSRDSAPGRLFEASAEPAASVSNSAVS